MSQDPLVSVGIPTYNRPEKLRLTLEEILGQTYSNLEIIIQDNASTNPAVEELGREIAGKEERVQYHRNDENLGPFPNFQRALERATGELFCWFADDDHHDPVYIEKLARIHQQDDYGLVAPNCRLFDLKGPCEVTPMPDGFWGAPSQVDTVMKMLSTDHFDSIKACFVYGLYQRPLLKECFLDNPLKTDMYVGWDLALLYRIASRKKCYFLDEKLWKHNIDIVYKGKRKRSLSKIPKLYYNALFRPEASAYHGAIEDYIAEIRADIESMELSESERSLIQRKLWWYRVQLLVTYPKKKGRKKDQKKEQE